MAGVRRENSPRRTPAREAGKAREAALRAREEQAVSARLADECGSELGTMLGTQSEKAFPVSPRLVTPRSRGSPLSTGASNPMGSRYEAMPPLSTQPLVGSKPGKLGMSTTKGEKLIFVSLIAFACCCLLVNVSIYFAVRNAREAWQENIRCDNASLALLKVRQLVGAHLQRGGISVDELDAGEDILQGLRRPKTFARIQAVISRAALSDVIDHGIVITSDDINKMSQCMLHQDGIRLEERATTASGKAVAEGDIVIPPQAARRMRRRLGEAAPERTYPADLLGDSWNNGEVDYCFAEAVPERTRSAWRDAARQLTEEVPCLKLNELPTTPESRGRESCRQVPSIYITAEDDGCWSYAGKVSNVGEFSGRSQPLNLGPGCETTGMTAHQLGHALGLMHTQARPDRGDWIHVFPERAAEGMEQALTVDPGAFIGWQGVTYDILSLMHASSTAFSKDGQLTFKPHDDEFMTYIGQRVGFSGMDVKQLGVMYGCSDRVKPSADSTDLLVALAKHIPLNVGPLTKEGCLCQAGWWPAEGLQQCTEESGWCCNPDNDPMGPWCVTQGGCHGRERDYCRPQNAERVSPTTLKGCTCRSESVPDCATTQNGYCCNSNGDPNGDWCFTEGECGGLEYDYCRVPTLPVDCKLSEWSEWGQCSTSCDEGQRVRRRTVLQEGAAGGKECEADHFLKETENCEVVPCHTTTSTTTAMFPIVIQTVAHLKYFAKPELCLGVADAMLRNGNVPVLSACGAPHPGMHFILPAGGEGPIKWAAFPDMCLNSPGGTQLQWWNCAASHEANIQFVLPVDGQGPIRAQKTKMCVAVAKTTSDLEAALVELRDCPEDDADVVDPELSWQLDFKDCAVGEWSRWSECSAHCGGGRTRRVKVDRPDLGDAPGTEEACGGVLSQEADCNMQACAATLGHEPKQDPHPQFIRVGEDKCLAYTGATTNGVASSPGNFILADCIVGPHQLFMVNKNSEEASIRWAADLHQCVDLVDLKLKECVPGQGLDLVFTNGHICSAGSPHKCLEAPTEGAKDGLPIRVGDCETDGDCAELWAHTLECLYGEWSEWGACSDSCGKGTRTRRRMASGPLDGVEACQQRGLAELVSQTCNDFACPG